MDGTTFFAPQGVTPASPAPGRTAILVAGVSRSGTSLLAHSLHRLGAALPDALVGAAPGNPLGHWEPAAIVALNDRILASLGLAWHDPRPVPQTWFASPAAAAWERRIEAEIDRLYGNAPLLLVKDPRLCRLLPLYAAALGRLGIAAKVILPIRPAAEVAQSLACRDGFSPGFGEFLWLRSLVDAERASRCCTRAWVTMDDLIANWQPAMQRLGAGLGVAWPVAPEAAAFLPRPSLRHHRLKRADGTDGLIAMAGDAAALAIAGNEARARVEFDRIAQLLDAAGGIYLPVVAEMAKRIEAYETSTCWRLTAWLRAIKRAWPA
jgi:hypothetical protein